MGHDLSSAGDWLFRQGDLVLGPLPAALVVEKLYAGELDSQSLVSKMGDGRFVQLGQVDVFKVHLAKAEAKLRVDHAAAKDHAVAKKKRTVIIAVAVAVTLVLAVVGAGTARYLAVYGGSDEDYGDLISVDPPTITLASLSHREEELIDYPFDTPAGAVKKPAGGSGSTTKPASGKPASKPVASAKPPASGKLSNVGDDPDGLQMATFDQGAINAVVAKQQKSLYPCLAAEAQRQPGLSARIPIEFVIGNDGKVAKVWVDHPSFKTGELPSCLLKALQRWQFKAYDGERATVGLSFKIGKG